MCQAKRPAELINDDLAVLNPEPQPAEHSRAVGVRACRQPRKQAPGQPSARQQAEAPVQPQARQTCGGSGSYASASVDGLPTRTLPDVPQPSLLILAAVGEASLRGLVRRHHDLLRASEIGAMFPADDAQFDAAVGQIADFVVESCGGPARYARGRQQQEEQREAQQENGGCLRSRHTAFLIDIAGRETWLGCLWQALQESGYPPAVREEYWNWSEPLSVRMVNRNDTGSEPRRYAYDSVQFRIRHPAFAMCRR